MNYAVKEYLRTLHHKKSIRAITTTAILLGLPFFGAYSYFFAVRQMKVDKVKVKIKNSHSNLKGLKICQISDLHFGPTNKDKAHFNRAVDLINAQNPDLVFLTGDYYQWDPSYLHGLPRLLSRLRAKIGVYASLGNHDYGSCYPGEQKNDPFEYHIIKEAFERQGITVLTNQSEELEWKGQKFNVVGLHDYWSGMMDPDEAFAQTNLQLPTFLLSHNPDTIELVPYSFDVMFSGHCHGGQMKWPLVGTLVMPVKNEDFCRGLHQITERKHLYVNRGLGYTFRMRVNSIPEVTAMEIE